MNFEAAFRKSTCRFLERLSDDGIFIHLEKSCLCTAKNFLFNCLKFFKFGTAVGWSFI